MAAGADEAGQRDGRPADLLGQLSHLTSEVSAGPVTAVRDAVLCLLESVEVLLPLLGPPPGQPTAGDLDAIDGQLRALQTSLRTHLWQTPAGRPGRLRANRRDDACNQ